MSTCTRIRTSTLLLAMLATFPVLAEEIFTWEDSDGVTHYSQWAPEDSQDVSTLVVNPSNPPGYDPLDDPYSIRNQAERMNETWLALEEKRAERRQKRRDETTNWRSYASPDYVTDPYFRSTNFYAPGYRPIYQPVYRPINRPGARPLPGGGQLQRPGLVNRVQRQQFNATSSNRYDPFRSAGISAPESGRQTTQTSGDF